MLECSDSPLRDRGASVVHCVQFTADPNQKASRALQITTALSKQFREMPAEQRAVYDQRYVAAREQYARALAEWEKTYLIAPPVRPLNGYMRYAVEQRKQRGTGGAAIAKQLAEEYKNMSAEEKVTGHTDRTHQRVADHSRSAPYYCTSYAVVL